MDTLSSLIKKRRNKTHYSDELVEYSGNISIDRNH